MATPVQDRPRSAEHPRSLFRLNRRRLITISAISLFVVVDLVLVGLAFARTGPTSSPAGPAAGAPAVAAPPPVVAIAGGPLASGTLDGGRGDRNAGALLGARYGWQMVDTGSDRGSWVVGPAGGTAYSEQTAALVRAQPGLIIVAGGPADTSARTSTLRVAVVDFLEELKRVLPQSRIVVVGPVFGGALGADAPPDLAGVRDVVIQAAGPVQVPVIDPIAEGWLAGDPALTTPDSRTATDAGHARIADRLAADLVRLNLAPS